MTKKHFELVAKVLRENRDKMDIQAFVKLTNDFVAEFKKENPRFDAAKFFKAVD